MNANNRENNRGTELLSLRGRNGSLHTALRCAPVVFVVVLLLVGLAFTTQPKDKSYDDVVSFLSGNRVSDNVYYQGEYKDDGAAYNCFSFAADLIVDAREEGFKCGLVWIDWNNHPTEEGGSYYMHVMLAFDTRDKGTIFVEPRTDEIIDLAIGEQYMYGKVTNMVIIW